MATTATATKEKAVPAQKGRTKAATAKVEPMELAVPGNEIPGFDCTKVYRDRSTKNGWRQVGMISTRRLMALTGGFDGQTYDPEKINIEGFQRAKLGFGGRSYKFELARDLLIGRAVPTLIIFQKDGSWYLEDGQQRTDSIIMALNIALKAADSGKGFTTTEKAIFDAAIKYAALKGLQVLTFDEIVDEEHHAADVRGDYTPDERLDYFDIYNRKGAKVTTKHIVEQTSMQGGWQERIALYGFDFTTENNPNAAKPDADAEDKKPNEQLSLLLACCHAYATGNNTSGVKDMDEADARNTTAAKLDKIGDTTVSNDLQWLFSDMVPLLQEIYDKASLKEEYGKLSSIPSAVKHFNVPAELMVVSVCAALGQARDGADAKASKLVDAGKEALIGRLRKAVKMEETDPLNLDSDDDTSLMSYYSKIRSAVGTAQRKLIYQAFLNLFVNGDLYREDGAPLNWKLGA